MTLLTAKDDARAFLQESLNARCFTGGVAEAILILLDPASGPLRTGLIKLAAATNHGMPEEYRHPDRFSEREKVAYKHLFKTDLIADEHVNDYAYVQAAKQAIEYGVAELGFPTATPDGVMRSFTKVGYINLPKGLHKKHAKKAARFLKRLQERVDTFQAGIEEREVAMIAKSRLAYQIDTELLSDESLSMVAYLVARAGRRTTFSYQSQSKAFDHIHEELVKLVESSDVGSAEWAQIALAYPVKSVLERLTKRQLTELSDQFGWVMFSCLDTLETLWKKLPSGARSHLTCVQGADTHRWNTYAGAYNTMRAAVLSAEAVRMPGNFDLTIFPGKVARLIAADLRYGYDISGNPYAQTFSDENLWHILPRPWDVADGTSRFPVELVSLVPGWLGPFTKVQTEEVVAELALVHGIPVDDPNLAQILRSLGTFSGKA